MATFEEIRSIYTDSNLVNKMEVAVAVKAHAILQEASPSTTRKDWARTALVANLRGEADMCLRYALAAHKDLTVGALKDATDVDLLAAASAAIDKLYP
jgi:hypothetical protein